VEKYERFRRPILGAGLAVVALCAIVELILGPHLEDLVLFGLVGLLMKTLTDLVFSQPTR